MLVKYNKIPVSRITESNALGTWPLSQLLASVHCPLFPIHLVGGIDSDSCRVIKTRHANNRPMELVISAAEHKTHVELI